MKLSVENVCKGTTFFPNNLIFTKESWSRLQNGELSEFKEELLGAYIAELDGGLLVLARALNLQDFSDAKALMLNGHAFAKLASGRRG